MKVYDMNLTTGEKVIWFSPKECKQMAQMIRGAALPLRREFWGLLKHLEDG